MFSSVTRRYRGLGLAERRIDACQGLGYTGPAVEAAPRMSCEDGHATHQEQDMGLFDSIVGQVAGALNQGDQGQAGGLLEVVSGLINNPQTGGLQGLIQSFEQNGLGGVIGSWVGTGQNLPISGEQLQAVLGNEQVQALAQKFGISPQDISSHLAQLLPQAVDTVTPGGVVPQGDALQSALGALGGLFK
jgi:uncharacterized protein YidB (DUF937 family)